MKQDRSGRTLEDYRELFWEAEKTIKELEAKLEATIESLTQQNKDLFARNVELRLQIVRVRKEVDALLAAIGEQE